MIANLITTYNRPTALACSLPQIVALGWPTLVIDDGSEQEAAASNRLISESYGALYLRLPENRGLAAAMNVGLSYWLADKDVEWVSYWQDDVDLAGFCGETLLGVMEQSGQKFPLITGHDAAEHLSVGPGPFGAKLKTNCRATHLLATRDYWLGVMPIPTRALHAPFRIEGQARGYGSEVDHWITHRAPNSIVKQGGNVLCVTGLVRTFLWEAKDSCWSNRQKAGADPEFGDVR